MKRFEDKVAIVASAANGIAAGIAQAFAREGGRVVIADVNLAATEQAARGQGSGAMVYMGSVHSNEASRLKAPYVAAKHGLMGLCKVVAKEGVPYNARANTQTGQSIVVSHGWFMQQGG